MTTPAATGRKAEIVEAALQLAFEGGPNRVTTVAIAERLGLTQPALYRHFRNKSDLWQAITDRLGGEVTANIEAAQSIPGPALGKLRRLVSGHIALVSRTPALPEIMVARDPASDDAVVRAAMQSRMAAFQRALADMCAAAQAEGALRDDIDPADMTALVMGVVQSLVLRLLLSRDLTVITKDGDRLLDLQLAAFARQSEA